MCMVDRTVAKARVEGKAETQERHSSLAEAQYIFRNFGSIRSESSVRILRIHRNSCKFSCDRVP